MQPNTGPSEKACSMRALSSEEKASLTAGATMWTTVAVPDAGIASLKMADGPMGIASGRVDERDVSLLTPCPAALGASWDIDLVHRVGALVGGEAVRLGVDVVLAPNINLARSPLAGRAFEYFSEDPLLTGLLGTSWAMGIQSTGTASVVKHLVCNDSETQRDTMNATVDERTLREVYLLPFEIAADANCAGMLTGYNRINGEWCSEQAHVISEIVKNEWGYRGFVVSDWFGTHSTVATINAGLDLEMPGPARFLGHKVAEAMARGEVTPTRIDNAVQRLAEAARKFTDDKQVPLGKEEGEALLVEAAAAGFTLLKNDGDLLPLVPGRERTIAVIGPNAAAPCFQGGTFAKIAVKADAILPVDAIRARYGAHCTILFEPGVDPQPRLPTMPVTPARDIGDGHMAGMTVDYFDNDQFDGAPVGSETRDINSLVWFVGVHDMGVFDRAAGIRASGRFTPTRDGEHIVYLGGTGAVRMLIDDREVLRRDQEIAASDVMGKLKNGDADHAAVMLQAGKTVLIEVEFRYSVARVQGLWYGLRTPDTPLAMLERAVAAAKAADAVILVVGETSDSSVESKDRSDTRLPQEQIRLIERVTAANPRTAIIANVGHAFDTSWDELAPALMIAWYPGQEFGPALAEVLAGDREPGGRLPLTIAVRDEDYPAFNLTPDADGNLDYAEGTRIGYRGLADRGITPRHAFGSGFGYAQFAFEDVSLDQGDPDLIAVTLTIRNISGRTGSEVVQVYRTEPELTLIGFRKVHLAPGMAIRITIPLERRRFQLWNDGWRDLGNTKLLVGRSSSDTPFHFALERPSHPSAGT